MRREKISKEIRSQQTHITLKYFFTWNDPGCLNFGAISFFIAHIFNGTNNQDTRSVKSGHFFLKIIFKKHFFEKILFVLKISKFLNLSRLLSNCNFSILITISQDIITILPSVNILLHSVYYIRSKNTNIMPFCF